MPSVTKSEVEVGNKYIQLMDQMAPQVLSDMFVPAFPNTSAGRRCSCWYRAEAPDVTRV
jgi:hypothetical protein